MLADVTTGGSPQGYYRDRSLPAEYAIQPRMSVGPARRGCRLPANLVNSGWQVSASYILTGEDNRSRP